MTSISTGVALVVLFSALIHASWNAILKSGSHKLMDAAIICFFGSVFSFIVMWFLPPAHIESWPYIAASVIVHVVYFLCLANSYKHSDLSHAYPLMRGLAPPFVALFAFLIAGESLPLIVWAGILLISLGILFPGRLNKNEITPKSVLFIIATAACIVSYTIIDGLGVRLSGNAASYVIYTSLFEGIIFVLMMWLYVGRKNLITYASKRWFVCAIAGVASICAYGLVLWAMERTSIGIVSALRETSIIFGTLIGIYFFKEGFGKRRIVTALLICLGALLIKLY